MLIQKRPIKDSTVSPKTPLITKHQKAHKRAFLNTLKSGGASPFQHGGVEKKWSCH